MPSFDFNLPPEEAIDYLKSKGYEITFDYKEMLHEAHHKAFTVAKIMNLDLLKDVHESLINAQKQGIHFETWKENIKETLIDYGWYGEVEVFDERTGETKNIYVGSRRLKTIFYTNMRTSYQVGRYKKMMNLENAVYWRYVALMDSRVRPAHAALHGMIRHRDDPFWQKNYPPNAWNCRCKVQAYTKEQIKDQGWDITPETTPPPQIYRPDPDWAYNVGEGSNYEKVWQDKLKSLNQCPEANAKDQYIKELYRIAKEEAIIDPKKFKKFFDNPKKDSFLIIANLPSYIKQALNSSVRNIRLSAETLIKNKNHHPEIQWYEYLLVDYLLRKNPLVAVKNSENTVVVIKGIVYNYAIILKTTKSKTENYLTSFRRINDKGIEEIIKQGEIIKGAVR